MRFVTKDQKMEVLSNFQIEKEVISERSYGSGHINDTFLVELKNEVKENSKLILQRINSDIFLKPEEVMENILKVTSFLKEKIIANGGNPDREVLNIIPTIEKKPYYIDKYNNYWRCYKFIDNAVCYNQMENSAQLYECASAFGNFCRLLSDYPVHTLHETIKGFHDTKVRLEAFKRAVKEDANGRVKEVEKEIQFVLERENIANYFTEMLDRKELPLRVTHNDTKLNNVMIDSKTGKGLCVIDLDTVMPGLAMNDFGDAIRFGASTAAEDEPNLTKVSCSMDLFESYTKGFLKGCGGKLTEIEIELMPMGAKIMTYECGMRFLMDYIQGDVYFKIHRKKQNLDRCRTQFKLVEDMENKWSDMQKIVRKAWK